MSEISAICGKNLQNSKIHHRNRIPHERRTIPRTCRQPQGGRSHSSRQEKSRPKHHPPLARCEGGAQQTRPQPNPIRRTHRHQPTHSSELGTRPPPPRRNRPRPLARRRVTSRGRAAGAASVKWRRFSTAMPCIFDLAGKSRGRIIFCYSACTGSKGVTNLKPKIFA